MHSLQQKRKFDDDNFHLYCKTIISKSVENIIIYTKYTILQNQINIRRTYKKRITVKIVKTN